MVGILNKIIFISSDFDLTVQKTATIGLDYKKYLKQKVPNIFHFREDRCDSSTK